MWYTTHNVVEYNKPGRCKKSFFHIYIINKIYLSYIMDYYIYNNNILLIQYFCINTHLKCVKIICKSDKIR